MAYQLGMLLITSNSKANHHWLKRHECLLLISRKPECRRFGLGLETQQDQHEPRLLCFICPALLSVLVLSPLRVTRQLSQLQTLGPHVTVPSSKEGSMMG